MGKETLISLSVLLLLHTTDMEKEEAEGERGRDIKPKLGGKSGWWPKATKTVLHVEPTNISEVLNMNPIRPGPVRKGKEKKEMKRERKGEEKVG